MISGIIIANTIPPPTDNQLPKIGELTRLQHIVNAMLRSRVTDLVVVCKSGEEVRKELEQFSEVIVAEEVGEFHLGRSMRNGVNHLTEKEPHGLILCPVEIPFISQWMIVDILQMHYVRHGNIVYPSDDGKIGFPILFTAEYIPIVERYESFASLEGLIREFPHEVRTVSPLDARVIPSEESEQ